MGGVLSALTGIISSIIGGIEAGLEAAGLVAVDVIEYEGAGLGAGLGADLGAVGDTAGNVIAQAWIDGGTFDAWLDFSAGVPEFWSYAGSAGGELAGIGTQTVVTPLGFFVFGTAGTLATAGLGAGVVLAATGSTSGNSSTDQQPLQKIVEPPLVDLADRNLKKNGGRGRITKCNGVRVENRRGRNKRMLSTSSRVSNKRSRRDNVCKKIRPTSGRKVRRAKK